MLVAAVTSAPGWPRVQASFFDPAVAVESLPAILRGLWLNLRVLAVAAVLTVVLAMVVAVVRTLRGPVWLPLRLLATVYVDLFRGVPLIVLLYIIGFGVPALRFTEGRISAVVLGTAAIVLTYAAYVSEVFRAGIDTVHPSQRLGARSLGLSVRAVDAAGRAAAGGPPRDAAAAQRLRRHAEGRRPHLAARRRGRRPGRADRRAGRRSTSPRTWSRRCCSCCCRCRRRGWPTGWRCGPTRREQAGAVL